MITFTNSFSSGPRPPAPGPCFRHFSRLLIAFFVIMGLFWTGSPTPCLAQNVVLKIGTLAPEGSAWAKAFRDINKELEQKTSKQVTLRLFPGGVLGDEEDMLRKIKVGQIQGALLTGGGLGLIFKDIKALGIPFLFQNYQEVDAVLARMDGFFQQGLSDNGFKSMGWAEQGFIYLFSKEPIRNAADLKKSKVWIWEDTPLGKAVFKELGVNPIPLPISDVLMALQTGMVETVYISPLAAISMQWFTKVSFMTSQPLAYSAGAVVVKKSDLEKIPAVHRTTVEDAFRRQLSPLKERLRQEDQKAIQVLSEKGIRLITISAADAQELRNRVFKGVANLGEEYFTRKTFEEIRNFLKTVRKEN